MILEGNPLFLPNRINTEDQDLYRYKDARVTTNFDRTKYNFNFYFFAQHYHAVLRRSMSDITHPDDPRVFKIYNSLAKLESTIQYS